MKTNSVPKIRFKGFTDDWEQRKLGELSNIVGGGTPSTSNSEYWDGDIDWYAPAEIGEQRYVSKSKKTITELGLKKSSARILPVGTVLFTSRAGIGNTAILGKEATTNQGFQSIVPNPNKLDSYFIYSRTNELKRYGEVTGTGSTFVEVSGKQMSKMPIMIPELSEQKKIGSFFEQLDNTIALHQRKCEQTKELKKFMLQKMFPKKGEKNPEIRFPGFTDDWEQRKLEKHIIEYHEVTTENNQYPVLTSSRKGIFLQTDYYSGNQVASADNTGYNIVPYGYFTYRHMSDDEIFHFNINDIVENGIVSTLYPVFTTDEKLDSRYLQYQLNYGSEFARFAVLQKQGGSRTYMYLNKLKKLSLTMPTSIDEQKKISSFLMSLDNLITLHQRKCEQLKELKKFMLQNMFPKKG